MAGAPVLILKCSIGSVNTGDGVGIVRLVRVGLEPGDQLGDAFGGMGIAHQDEHRIVGHHRDRHEVVEDAVGDLLPDGGADGHGAGRGAEQRVAVGRRLRDGLRCEPPGGAGLVLDQDGAADRFLQLLGEDARDRVGAAAGAESDDDPDRAVGVIDLLRPRLERPRRRPAHQSEELTPFHAQLLFPGRKNGTGSHDMLERGVARR